VTPTRIDTVSCWSNIVCYVNTVRVFYLDRPTKTHEDDTSVTAINI